jgi:hypothetical protein
MGPWTVVRTPGSIRPFIISFSGLLFEAGTVWWTITAASERHYSRSILALVKRTGDSEIALRPAGLLEHIARDEPGFTTGRIGDSVEALLGTLDQLTDVSRQDASPMGILAYIDVCPLSGDARQRLRAAAHLELSVI